MLTCAPNVPAGVVYEGYRNRLYQEEWIDGIRTVRVWTYLAANRGRVRRGLNFLSYMAAAGAAGAAAAAARRRRDRHLAAVLRRLGRRAGRAAPTARRSCSRSATSGPTRSPPSGRCKEGRVVRALERLERALYDAADHIVAVGEGYRQNMIRKGVPADKIDVVTNGVDADLFTPRPADAALRDAPRLRAGHVRRHLRRHHRHGERPRRGAAAPRAASSEQGRDDVAFLLIGDGAVRAELEAQARAQGLDNVVFTGLVPRAELPALPGEQRRLPRALPQAGALLHHPALQVLRGRGHGEAHPAGLRG